MGLQNSFGQKRKTDRQAGGEAGPPQRRHRPGHLFFAKPANDFIDHGRARARSLLDVRALLGGDLEVFRDAPCRRVALSGVPIVGALASH